MSELLSSLFWLVIALGLLITFHEFGHYWVAKRCGVRVLCFSVGFGKTLWSRTDRNGVEWRIAAIPLGGYVRMLDESEAALAGIEPTAAFNRRPVGQRIAIVAAGPLANLLLAVALLYLMFLVGKPDFAPVLQAPEGIAAEAGLASGDRLLSIDGRATPTWTEANQALLLPLIDRRPVEISVLQADGDQIYRQLPLQRIDPALEEAPAFAAIGLRARPPSPPPVVAAVLPGSPASGRLQAGDRILAIDGEPVHYFADLATRLARHPPAATPPALLLEVLREGQRLELTLTAAASGDPDTPWRIGIQAGDPRDAILRHGPIEALPQAFIATARLSADTVGVLVRMVTGGASLSNLSGPITIAQVANTTASRGLAWFLYFLALLSVGIAILNLLPIPVLDGGHLLYYLIELARGRPLGQRALLAGQYLGLVLLASLMGLALFNDVLRLLS